MKLKLDENLPESLLSVLKALGHEVDNVRIEGLAGHVDANVWQAAQRTGRFLLTQDLDFSDVRKFAPGAHHGLMVVRLRAPGAKRLPNGSLEFSARRWPTPGKVVLSSSRIIS